MLDKLRAELDSFMQKREATGPIQMKEALELPYLQAVIKEGLRLFPATGLPMPRVVPPGGLDLVGHHFPEGVRSPSSTGCDRLAFLSTWEHADMFSTNRRLLLG